ncbi:MAG TPA: hypothetical protein VK095_13290, partial [Beutenbergiaceae bacterium]|nr:hypothetical protein [Beutenbergiaceae bacterium]
MTRTRRSTTILATTLGIGLITGVGAAADEIDQMAEIATDPPVCELKSEWNGLYYDYYLGHHVIPSTTEPTASGLEAQCALAYWSEQVEGVPHPGTYDGIFGPQSQASMRAYQEYRNGLDADLGVDGLP